MQRRTKYTLYGFEDYEVLTYPSRILDPTSTLSRYDFYQYSYQENIFYFVEPYYELPLDKQGYGDYVDWDSLVKFNDSILDNAKSLYIYPDCKIPKRNVAVKYKRAKNPFLADAIVLPPLERHNSVTQGLFFINESAKKIFIVVNYSNKETFDSSITTGTKFSSILTPKQHLEFNDMINVFSDENYKDYREDIKDLLDSEVLASGSYITIFVNDGFKLDILSGVLPADKFVSEKAVMKSLGNQDNEITFENLMSIKEMLRSSDYDTQGSAIKALASMDYMSCPVSVKYVLSERQHNWCYNKATNTTTAKFMFKSLINKTARGGIWFREKEISEKDYEILHKLLLEEYENDETKVDYWLRNRDFTYEDVNYNIYPRLKNVS